MWRDLGYLSNKYQVVNRWVSFPISHRASLTFMSLYGCRSNKAIVARVHFGNDTSRPIQSVLILILGKDDVSNLAHKGLLPCWRKADPATGGIPLASSAFAEGGPPYRRHSLGPVHFATVVAFTFGPLRASCFTYYEGYKLHITRITNYTLQGL